MDVNYVYGVSHVFTSKHSTSLMVTLEYKPSLPQVQKSPQQMNSE